ncbi:hypothetical protein BD769DRAFT_1633461 [Suillus cothurnatus]|nr:hypothetical protein BD769DRAFT_1633461 [Suillus cothurnatus]
MSVSLTKHCDTPPFADHKDLYNVIDATQLGDVPWQSFSVQYTGECPEVVPPWMNDEFEVWYRDPRAMAYNILANPTFKDEINYTPFHEYNASDNTCQWKDFMSGDWAWQQADTISKDPETHGSALVPIILGSDKTTVSVGTGNTEYYPLYASIGNVCNNVRHTHHDALVIISFLAIPKRYDTDKKHSKDDVFWIFHCQLIHSLLSVILSSLKSAMSKYEVVHHGDSHFRRMTYSLGPYIADYEEQLVLSCVIKHWCPKCIAVRTDLDSGGMYHCCEHTDFIIGELHEDILWNEYGIISDLVLFTNDFLRADIHELLSFDLLHQLIKGAFKDHLVDWVAKYLKAVHGTKRAEEIMSDIDRRVAAVPSFSGRDFKQWTGNDSKALMKVFLPAIEGHVPGDMVCAFYALLEFCYLVQRNVITEDTLNQIQDALGCFHCYRKIFGLVIPTFSLPRQHSMTHYASNRHNALGQMLVTNQRLDKLAAFHMDFNRNQGDHRDPEDIPTGSYPWNEGKLQVFNSASATFLAPSDPSDVSGMNEYTCNDCMQGLEVARIICFFSFIHNWEGYLCALIQWFDKIGDCVNEDTGMWMDGSQNLAVIHIDTIFRAAHLIPIYSSEYISHSLKFYHSIDSFHSFYVNKFADHHAFGIAS